MSTTPSGTQRPRSSQSEGRTWIQTHLPHRPSSLRRTNTSSLPRSQRVTSLVDLLPTIEIEEEPCAHTRSLSEDHEMTSPRRRTNDSARKERSSVDMRSSGLGISMNLNQRLDKVDEWLEAEKHVVGGPSHSVRERTPTQPRGPRKYSSHRSSIDPELLPSPLGPGKDQPTTPGGGPRAFTTPEPKPEDVYKESTELIDEMLEDLYRTQAKSLSKSKDDIDINSLSFGHEDLLMTPSRNSTAKTGTALPAESTPTRRVPSTRRPSSSQTPTLSRSFSQQSSGFAPSPSRNSDRFHPSPLRISRKPVLSPPRITVNSEKLEPTTYELFHIFPDRTVLEAGPRPVIDPPTTFGHRIFSKPETVDNSIVRAQHQRSSLVARPRLYFFDDERESILQSVLAQKIVCTFHKDCHDCFHREFAYFEIKAMPTSIPPEERAKILAGNRSLRTIKTELENLLENGLISDDAYNNVMHYLPSEGNFNASRSVGAPAPTAGFQALTVNDAPPPAYQTPNPPSLPTRQNTAPPGRPEISRAIALYPYSEPDDCTFIVGDEIAVYEHMNKDWWMGRNVRTGKEGVFPVNYVTPKGASPPGPNPYGNEKANSYSGYPAQQQHQYNLHQQYNQHHGPPPPGPSNPYNSDTPPSAVANEPSKGAEMGKKFGKKLGNAAIFGAGASIGGKIVNGIF